MLPSVGVASAIHGGNGSASVIDSGASVIDGGASVIDGAAHPNSRQNFFSTETFHRNVKDVPKAHRVAVRNTHCVRQQRAQMMVQCGEGETTGVKNKPHHAAHCADSANNCRTQNIVPSEKWQLGHCAK